MGASGGGPAHDGRAHDRRPSGHAPRWRCLELARVDSTQAEAARLAAAGERGPLWIRAGVQTAGRGRQGRSWSSPEGNLAATLLFEPGCPPGALAGLSILAGVAAAEALAPLLVPAPGAAGLRLKWPNDLMVGAAKLGGILVESTTLATTTLAMIGIGINIAEAPPVAGRGVTCLARHVAGPPSPQRLLEEIAAPMAAWIASWRGGEGFAAVRAAWLARGQEPGEPIAVRVGEEEHRGTFGGLETDGALVLVDAAGGRRRFTFGDVTAVTEGVEGQWRAR